LQLFYFIPTDIQILLLLKKMLKQKFFIIYYFIFCLNVISQKAKLTQPFDSALTPIAPDYGNISSWAALPFISDEADTVAGLGKFKNLQNSADADIFFIHPTSYTNKPFAQNPWNGDIIDKSLNNKTTSGSIRYQASVFNGAGKIYAPLYRQAHYYSYFTTDTLSARLALDVAYYDIKTAFELFLKNYNNGRPIIIASHSQGTTHAIRLLKDFFENKPLMDQLVCAYLVGMPVYESTFYGIKPCQNKYEIECYCSWRTYATDYYPKKYKSITLSICTNPLTWETNSKYASAELNKGGILRDMKTIIPELCDAQVGDGVLRINKPNFRGKAFLRIKNYHIADYNLFYLNIRENAILRVNEFLKSKA
jgi:hypothetical protein